MLEVSRARQVAAPPGAVWPLVDDLGELARWLAFADSYEVLEGDGLGRRQRQHGRWGSKRSEVDQLVTAYQPERLLAWQHLAERLDGKPAPRFARSTEFTVSLEPSDGGTLVRLTSRQEPAGALRGAVMRAFGTRQLARGLDASLVRLAELVA
jgi:uncharacterized protein YndB with AHSA1/START domain